MDEKTKSIIIGLVAAFAAVIIIILLFFSISGINGSGTDNKGKSNKRSYSESVSVDSEGNRVVIIDDEDNEDEDEDDKPASSEASDEESSEVSSEEEKVQKTGFFGLFFPLYRLISVERRERLGTGSASGMAERRHHHLGKAHTPAVFRLPG